MIPLAFDLGASSVRAAIGQFDGERLDVREVHRFPNDSVRIGDRLHWDILRIYHEVKQGFIAAKSAAPGPITSFGIDSWGLDFGLLDRNDELIGNPYHYRDDRNPIAAERVVERVPRAEIFARTGIQFTPINTLNQFEALRNSRVLAEAETFLQIPDLVRFFLTGEKTSEYTDGTTTQFMGLHSRSWDRELLAKLDLPHHMLGPIVEAPLLAGSLRAGVAAELGVGRVTSTVIAEHDTASAVAAIPAEGDFAYVSCGTWALLGTELDAPIADARALEWNFTNEGGLNGTYRLLKNICGLWLLESCRRSWATEGTSLSFDAMHAAIASAEPFRSLIDPDAPEFFSPSSMPEAIRAVCSQGGQPAPESQAQILRCLHESLALKFQYVFDRVERLSNRRFSALHLVGGGANNATLCQFTANAIGRPVLAGPIEATVIGNLLVQLIATGHIANVAEAREVVRRSFPVTRYEPVETLAWQEQCHNYEAMLEREQRARNEGR